MRRWTAGGLDEFFRPNPAEFNNSEAHFRVLGMASVLQRHCGVRYDPSKIGAGPEVPFDLHDSFVYGVMQGLGGTCATLPVVYAAIGRRLGYPIRLVCTKAHLFARWDDPKTGERFNIECSGQGFGERTDDEYRKWPFPITAEEEQRFGYLKSMTPRQELASLLSKRAFVFSDHKRYREAVELFCMATELVPELATYPRCVSGTLHAWELHLQKQFPPRFPRVDVLLRQDRRRWHAVPWEIERHIFGVAAAEGCLTDPDHCRWWWNPLRRGEPPMRALPSAITVNGESLPFGHC